MTTKEKAAYLKGLADGMGLLDESNNGRVLSCIVDILSALSADVEDLEDRLFELSEEVDQLGSDLDEVGDILCGDDEDSEFGCGGCRACFDEDDDEDDDACCCDEDDEDCLCCSEDDEDDFVCRCCGGHDEDDDAALPLFYEVVCPACGETITLEEDVLDLGGINCPGCGEHLEFDLEYEDDEDDDDDDEDDEDDD